MSATEVIEEIKKLPLEEQKKVLDFVQRMDRAAVEKEGSFEQSAQWAVEEHRELLRRLAQ